MPAMLCCLFHYQSVALRSICFGYDPLTCYVKTHSQTAAGNFKIRRQGGSYGYFRCVHEALTIVCYVLMDTEAFVYLRTFFQKLYVLPVEGTKPSCFLRAHQRRKAAKLQGVLSLVKTMWAIPGSLI